MNTINSTVANDEHELWRIDQAWNDSYPRNDSMTLSQILADEWICINGIGQFMSKLDLLHFVASTPDPFDSHEFSDRMLRVYGTTAIIVGSFVGTGKTDEGTFTIRQRYTRVYHKRDNEWRAIATQVTPIIDSPRAAEEST